MKQRILMGYRGQGLCPACLKPIEGLSTNDIHEKGKKNHTRMDTNMRIDIFPIMNIDRQDGQDEQEERLLHEKPGRAMIQCGFAAAQEYNPAVS